MEYQLANSDFHSNAIFSRVTIQEVDSCPDVVCCITCQNVFINSEMKMKTCDIDFSRAFSVDRLVIQPNESFEPGILIGIFDSGCSSAISGFLRRLFLPVLLEDERVMVCITSTQPMYKNQSAVGMANRLQHVHHGVGHCYRCLQFSINATFGDILSKITGQTSTIDYNTDQCGIFCCCCSQDSFCKLM